jgi:hypothetical protein
MCGKKRPRARQRDGSRPARVRHSPARHRSDLNSLDARSIDRIAPTASRDFQRSNDFEFFAETTCAR